MQSNQYEIAYSTFERIRAAFPALSMNLNLHHKHVDLAMDIPSQHGLSFDIHLNLQNLDELHLVASALWFEWFPCTNPKKVEQYFEAVSGLLSGQFRILENWRGQAGCQSTAAATQRSWMEDYRYLDCTAICSVAAKDR